jgi:hypothetical protein
LFDGGHVVVGSVDGAEQNDVGKTVDVTLHGDTAYTRSLTTPLALIVFGAGSAFAGLIVAVRLTRRPPLSQPCGVSTAKRLQVARNR